MFNIIKMNFYRLFHQMSFYVMIIVTALTSLFLVYTLYSFEMSDTHRNDETAAEMTDRQDGADSDIGIYFDTYETSDTDSNAETAAEVTSDEDDTYSDVGIYLDGDRIEKISLEMIVYEYYRSGFLLIILAVFAAIITNSENKHGYIKNIAGQLPQRGVIASAKLPVMLFQVLVVLVSAALFTALSLLIFYKEIDIGSFSELIKNTSFQLFLIFGFCSLISMITYLFGNPAVGIVTGIVLSSGLPSLIYGLINNQLIKLFGLSKDFDISVYSIETNIEELMICPSDNNVILRGIIVGAVYNYSAVGRVFSAYAEKRCELKQYRRR